MKKNVTNDTPEEILKIIRQWVGLNQEDFGKSINLSRGAIAKYENSQRRYTFETLLKICQIHGITITLEKNPLPDEKL